MIRQHHDFARRQRRRQAHYSALREYDYGSRLLMNRRLGLGHPASRSGVARSMYDYWDFHPDRVGSTSVLGSAAGIDPIRR